MDFKYLSEDDTMIDVFPDALVLHHFSSKVVEENLGQVKGSTLHKMKQNKLGGIGQKSFEPCS